MVIIADIDGNAAGFRDGDGTLPSSLIFHFLFRRQTSDFKLQTSDMSLNFFLVEELIRP